MRKILVSLLVIAAVSALAIGATGAWFVDNETSTGNTFNAGLLDLKVDGGDANVVKFTINRMVPGNQPTGSWMLSNAGDVAGYLDLHDVVVTEDENVITEPEAEAGDVTAAGELGSVVNLRLYLDADKDGYWSTGDVMLYNGKVAGIGSDFDQNIAVPAGGSVRINAVFDWWASADDAVDSVAMTDKLDLGIKFQLGQTTGQ